MSAQAIIILVGIVLVGVPILNGLSKGGPGSHLISPKVGVPLAILGVAMILYGSYTSDVMYVGSQMEQVTRGNQLEVEGPVTAVRVTSPIDGDRVDCRILSMGVYPPGHEKDIWVVLKPSDGRYYPQSDHTNTSYKRDGEWQVVTRFGGDLDEKYELIVYEADASASQFFSATIEAWKEQDSYPGLMETEIPPGATEVDRIEVYLDKNCRGVF